MSNTSRIDGTETPADRLAHKFSGDATSSVADTAATSSAAPVEPVEPGPQAVPPVGPVEPGPVARAVAPSPTFRETIKETIIGMREAARDMLAGIHDTAREMLDLDFAGRETTPKR